MLNSLKVLEHDTQLCKESIDKDLPHSDLADRAGVILDKQQAIRKEIEVC